jgi:SAM-dependent methyltransferase
MGPQLTSTAVIWHDLECGAYTADLPFWRELVAAAAVGPVLEIGAGTGRVTIDLARHGHTIIALERDRALADELRRRAGALPVSVICADACDFALTTTAGCCIVPMQTVQLLADRPAFLRCARAALRPGAMLALAVLGADVQPFEAELAADQAERDGVFYASAPTALRETPEAVILERRRVITGAAGSDVSLDVARLARVDAPTLAGEAAAAGFAERGSLLIAPTDQHAGSAVLLFEALAP